jgi:hypothetical protein
MPRRTWYLQHNLNRGEVSPLLDGRKDLQAYYNAAESELNVLSLPQGGATKRKGNEVLGSYNVDGREERFSFNTEQNYMLLFTHNGRMYVFKNKVLQTDLNGSGLNYILTPYTQDTIPDFDYFQSADTAVICHEDVETQLVQRTSDTEWTISAAPFTNLPQYDFNDALSDDPVSEIQLLNFNNHAEGDTYKLTLNELLTEEITLASDDDTNEKYIENALQRLINTGATGITVTTDTGWGAGTVIYRVTFAFASANDWDKMAISPVVTKSLNFNPSVTDVQDGTSRAEDSWSDTRGWPRTGTFHEGRAWMGGSRSRPNTVNGSRVNEYFNHDLGRGFDDEAIEVTLDTDQLNAINGIFSNRTLQVFTSGQEFYAPEAPLTPEKIAFLPQTNIGSKRVRPVSTDGATLFVNEKGKAIVQFLFVDDFKANQAGSISFAAEHLIKNPIKMSVLQGTSGRDANYVVINNDDGTLSIFNSLASEDVSGFTRWETPQDSSGLSEITSSTVVDHEIYTYVRRFVNGSFIYTVEVETDDCFLDSSVTVLGAGDTITGLDHLEGETVQAMADGAYMGEFTVSNGSITLQRASTTTRSAGFFFAPEIKTMKVNYAGPEGSVAYKKKKIVYLVANLFESNGVIINGEVLPDKTISVNQFDVPIPFTGVKRRRKLGWSLEAQVTITQTTPMPLTVRSIGMEVAV